MSLHQLYTKFFPKVFVDAYEEWIEGDVNCVANSKELAKRKSLAMAFPWPNLSKQGGLVISNFGPVVGEGMRLVWSKGKTTLCLQTVDSLLEDIRDQYPNEDWSA